MRSRFIYRASALLTLLSVAALLLWPQQIIVVRRKAAASGGSGAVETGTRGAIDTTGQSGSQSITVPADCTLLVVGVSGYDTGGTLFADGGTPLSIAGANLTRVAGNATLAFYYKTSPSTGSQTLAWNWGEDPDYADVTIQYWFVKGNAASPIKSSGVSAIGWGPLNTGSLNAASGDLLLAVGLTVSGTLSWTNATEVDERMVTIRRGAAVGAPSGAVTVTLTSSVAEEDMSVGAVVIDAL